MIVFGWLACGPLAPPVSYADLVVRADVDVIVRNGRIAEVMPAGTGNPRVGPATRVVTGQRVTAGFVDAHAHPVGYGRLQEELDLTGLPSLTATLDRVRRAPKDGAWLVGRGWDQNDWPEGRWPTASDLDAVTGDRPTFLTRIDGHAAWVNQATLDQAGLTAGTPDPPGGRLLRDAAGRPTGVLVDAAMDLVERPAPTPTDLRRHLDRGLTALAKTGLTGVHVMGIDDATLAAVTQADREGALPLRLWVYVAPDTETAERLKREGPWSGDKLRVMGVKLYADGALGSRGAHLSAPYADRPDHRGLTLMDAPTLATWATALDDRGAQVAIHAIGDQAVHEALDAIEAATPVVRHRVEHAQVVAPADVPRFAALDVIASVQPTHATSDRPWAEDRLGPERIAWAYRWRSLADAEARLAFGSDVPVESPEPARGLLAATQRDGWRTEEVVSLDEAVTAFTLGAATAVGDEGRLGSLTPGFLADLTVWDTEGESWAPRATIVEGAVVWSHE